jgi:hypothetical protein
MLKTEFFRKRKDGVNLYRTYSDANMLILQNETGIEYGEAIDIENSGYTYTETNKSIEQEEKGQDENEVN